MNKEIFVQCSEINLEWKCDVVGTPDRRLSAGVFLVNFVPTVLEVSSPKTHPGTSPELCFCQGPFLQRVQHNAGSASCLQCSPSAGLQEYPPLGGVRKVEVLSVGAAWLSISPVTLTRVLHLTFLP